MSRKLTRQEVDQLQQLIRKKSTSASPAQLRKQSILPTDIGGNHRKQSSMGPTDLLSLAMMRKPSMAASDRSGSMNGSRKASTIGGRSRKATL